ncbi:DUF1361 domain-containing protein [Spirulina subsalsa FACHB-351]|uniref:DUF1361 domain-containing protein n=1 Tax=Spirulina subsalsa FACHB-351 TaxID=234711 RepID=A0ABT3LBT2_9CYAN|nr:DUF1361 domain-containing protein [Spirulina subsalsa]MCW6038927.1 DUF1361 domain-containing protein [Spirulina subsalsa FACHB-351]
MECQLFRRRSLRRSAFWWFNFVVFIAFLPNAPYLLTDIIHLIRATRAGFSAWVITLVLIPQHLLAIIAGFEAYVISVMNVGHYLRKIGAKKFILLAELVIHLLSAIGVYLGRFQRFNSWDLITNPDDITYSILNDFTSKRPVFVMFITFWVLTILYWVMKEITLGLGLRMGQAWQKKENLIKPPTPHPDV